MVNNSDNVEFKGGTTTVVEFAEDFSIDEFNEEISDEVVEQLTTVGKAVEFIKEKVE